MTLETVLEFQSYVIIGWVDFLLQCISILGIERFSYPRLKPSLILMFERCDFDYQTARDNFFMVLYEMSVAN